MAGKRRHGRNWQGSKWCMPPKRLALYKREGFACIWCQRHVDDVALSLDHLIPTTDGGTNAPENLVTCCFLCNIDRAKMSHDEWPVFLAAFWDQDPAAVTARLELAKVKPLDRKWALATEKERPEWLIAMRQRASSQKYNELEVRDGSGE